MPILTPRLLIRPPQIGDAFVVNTAISESINNLAEFLPWAQTNPQLRDTEEFIRQSVENWILKLNTDPYLPLLIFNVNTKQFIGSTGFHNYDWNVPCLEIGYWQRNSCLGQGYMTEAVNAISLYAFKQLLAKRITITCDSTNIRSKLVAERLGFELEATLKNSRRNLRTNELSNTLIYSKFDANELPAMQVSWQTL